MVMGRGFGAWRVGHDDGNHAFSFGVRDCSKTGFTCSPFCASPGETPSDIAVTINPNEPVRITLRICLPPRFGKSHLFTFSFAMRNPGREIQPSDRRRWGS